MVRVAEDGAVVELGHDGGGGRVGGGALQRGTRRGELTESGRVRPEARPLRVLRALAARPGLGGSAELVHPVAVLVVVRDGVGATAATAVGTDEPAA